MVRCLLAVSCCGTVVAASVAPRAATSLGPVSGKVIFDRANAFQGIPYAADTGGANRFRPPTAREPWTDVKQVIDWAPGCAQNGDSNGPGADVPKNQSEDCLNLNVYTPLNIVADTSLPVFVFFHGGAFVEGWNDGPRHLYEASKFVEREQVIVVEPNYRLQALGFLVVNDSGIGGNFGIQDQRFALEWVRSNAAAFGGDVSRVTIGGQSAGAMSVGIHMASPPSHEYFQRAIMNSNFGGFRYKTAKEQKPLSDAFVNSAGCKKLHGAKMLSCLQALSTDEILKATGQAEDSVWMNVHSAVEQWSHLLSLALPWTPTVGTEDLPKEPHEAFEDGSAKFVPLLEGTVHDEGITFVGLALGKHINVVRGAEYGLVLDALFGKHSAAVKHRYPSDGLFKSVSEQIGAIVTDNWFKCGTQKLAMHNAEAGQPSFHYRYAHPITQEQLKAYTPALPEVCVNRSCHSTDLPALFGTFHYAASPTAMEQRIETQLMDLWGSFINGADVPSASNVPTWPLLDTERQGLLLGNNVTVETERELCEFWDSIGTYPNGIISEFCGTDGCLFAPATVVV